MDFMRNIQADFADKLRAASSWKIDFYERVSYTVKGDGTRSFVLET